MFGLPAAALAMYHEAKTEKKKIAAGILFSAALTSFLTGITEPIEFAHLYTHQIDTKMDYRIHDVIQMELKLFL